VATGKWGCGVFNGDPFLKFIIQWISCSLANRKLIFCTQMDPELKNIERFVAKVKSMSAGYLFSCLVKFYTSQTKLSLPMKGLRDFILQQAEIEVDKRSPLKSDILVPESPDEPQK
jgi:Poly (ADP-ribose) glycohydrolase (PARG)